MKITKIFVASMLAVNVAAGLTVQNDLELSRYEVPYSAQIVPEEEVQEIDITNYMTVYALHDTPIFENTSLVAATIGTINIGNEIRVYDEISNINEYRYYVTNKGYVKAIDCAFDKDYVFYPEESVKYARSNTEIVNIPSEIGDVIEWRGLNDEIYVNGYNEKGYYRIGEGLYVHEDWLMETAYVEPATPIVTIETASTPTYSYVPSGSGQLTPSAGVFYGPSGKETYYNLDMSGVIALAQSAGIYGEYAVRSDGVKTYDGYVMCACGFSVRPRGTVIETSLGTGICLDTGGFADSDPYQVDIAVSWW